MPSALNEASARAGASFVCLQDVDRRPLAARLAGMFGSRKYPPIHDRPPLLQFIRNQLDPSGRLADPLCALPDEEAQTEGNVRWAAGAMDGVMSYHSRPAPSGSAEATQLAQAIVKAAARPHRPELTDLYNLLRTSDPVGLVDATLEAVGNLGARGATLGPLATWLASESPDRVPVKFGLALLGRLGAPDRALIRDLGSHEEFTLFAAVALIYSCEDPTAELFSLAQRVTGWGRIHCVDRLSDTTNPAIARWILVEGFRNSVMNEYLALIAATTGQLSDVLAEGTPTREVLTAGTDIISALISGGPAGDIDDYQDAPIALMRWLGHMEGRSEELGDLLTIKSIRDFCDQDDWADRIATGVWTAEAREELQARVATLLSDPRWPALAERELASTDKAAWWRAEAACRVLGIDTFESVLARIDDDPLGGPWFQAWDGADRPQAEVLVDRAMRLLDLRSVASGPALEVGLGPTFQHHQALGWTLQSLGAFPGVGAEVLAVGLKSPAISNRNVTLRTLEAWGVGFWTNELRQLMQLVADGDPDPDVRERAGDLIDQRGTR
jgi:hypothetical protein